VLAVRGRCPLMLRTGWCVALRTTRVSASGSSTARVISETSTVTVRYLCSRPSATFWPATMITPVFEARRWTRIGSVEGRGIGPTGRVRWRVTASPGWKGIGSGAEQLAGDGVEEHQRCSFLDADPSPVLRLGHGPRRPDKASMRK
jgi:hypothetical protein